MILIEVGFLGNISCRLLSSSESRRADFGGYNTIRTYHLKESELFLLALEGRIDLVADFLSNRLLQPFELSPLPSFLHIFLSILLIFTLESCRVLCSALLDRFTIKSIFLWILPLCGYFNNNFSDRERYLP